MNYPTHLEQDSRQRKNRAKDETSKQFLYLETGDGKWTSPTPPIPPQKKSWNLIKDNKAETTEPLKEKADGTKIASQLNQMMIKGPHGNKAVTGDCSHSSLLEAGQSDQRKSVQK